MADKFNATDVASEWLHDVGIDGPPEILPALVELLRATHNNAVEESALACVARAANERHYNDAGNGERNARFYDRAAEDVRARKI